MKIVAFAGSNSSVSINRKLVELVLRSFPNEEIEFLDINDFEMPIYSIDREKNGFPDQAIKFRNYMAGADAIICSMAEHNRSYTVAFKNILDWCSRIDMNVFAGKPMLLMSTSTGGYGGGNVMNLAKAFFPRCGARVVDTFSLPSFKDNFNDGAIINPDLNEELKLKIETFKSSI
jgi:NAD(P)H-dependent FMN reductase